MFKKLSIALLLFVLTTNTSYANDINQQKDISISKEKSLTIKGKVVFHNSFKTKAESVSTLSTVSIIYPANDHKNPNKTIATGITNDSGYFSINPSPTFIPQNNQIFVVEAIKRVQQNYSNDTKDTNLQSLRSFIRWNGSNWDSITSNDLVIDKMTTGVSILSSYTNTNPNDTIGKISNGTASVIGNISLESINRLSDMVRVCLNEKRDPYASIKLIDNNYYIDRNYDVGKLLTSDDLTGLTLSYTNLAEANLSGKNLSNMDLTGINLSGAKLIETDLSYSIVNNANLSNIDFTRTNLTHVDLEGVNVSYSNLSNRTFSGSFLGTDFSNAELYGSDFSNATLQGAIMKGANLSNCNLSNLDLSGMDLTAVNFKSTIIKGLNIKNSNLSKSIFSHMDLSGMDLTGINFQGALLNGTNLMETILNSTDFRNAVLIDALLIETNLNGKDFTNTYLSYANLLRANIDNITLNNTRLSKTKWFNGKICANDSIDQCN
jgi:uncharacterized protein YjbI with pentapeptide repeats